MSRQENKDGAFDSLFAQKLRGHSVTPPPELWGRVQANTKATKQSRFLLWMMANDGLIML